MSPLWWLETLSVQLAVRQPGMTLLDRYYTGDHPLPFITRKDQARMVSEFRKLLMDSRSNFMRLVVDAVEERLRVEGFRLSASEDAQADKASWDIWQANQMDAQAQVAFIEALVKGCSYLSVWFDEDGDEFADIAVEDPLQTIVAYEPGSNYRRRAAALKIWRDDLSGLERANVYLPEGIHKFESKGSSDPATLNASERAFDKSVMEPRRRELRAEARWSPLPNGEDFVANPLGVVPIIPLRNRPRLLVEGESEIEDVTRVQDQINGFLFLLALAGYMGAHRQRWVSGVAIMEDSSGNPIEPFNPGVTRIWQSDNPDAKFGDFEQTELDGYIKAIEQKVLHIAVTTRTPRHYLIEQGQSPSGDAIKSAESGLTKKVERKQPVFGEGLEEALRLARRFQGEEDSPPDSEIIWADAEIRTEAEITDAAIKKFQAKVTTWEQTCQDLGYSPQQIKRMLAAFGGTPPEPSTPQPAAPLEPAA